jgi:UDP-2-acetamido-3-amino-2,3-dideoxy-glucuronate N-acetyltransferase
MNAGKRTTAPAIACIGAGYWGRNLVRNFHELGVLASIFEVSAESRRELARVYPDVRLAESFAEVLADPGVAGVAIATPAETHGELVRQALLAGKDVFVEKPLDLTVDRAKKLVELAAQRSRILMVGHLLWYHPAVRKLKELVQSGELGRIQYIYSNRLNLGRIRREENILWSFAPHDVSVILGLVGEAPDDVQARGGKYLHDRIADVTVSLLSFPSGVKAHVFVSWLHPFKEQKLVVVGSRRMAVFDDTVKQDKLVVYPHTIDWKDQIPVVNRAEGVPVPLEWVEPLRAECAHFLECIETRATPRTDGREALRVLAVLEACEQSLASGSPGPSEQEAPRSPALPGVSIHESAYVDGDVEVGEGTTVWHFSHLMRGSKIGRNVRIGQNVVVGPNAQVGDGVKIQNNVSVYEGVTLEEHVFCGPSMVFTNVLNPRSEIRRMHELRRTLVRRGATLGANCTIVCGVTIGEYAFVGAGAVVVKDVPDYALVVGNPGRIIGWMCACGNRIEIEDDGSRGRCGTCDRRYKRLNEGVTPE